jgi:peptidoglycan/xylan/chitin deacetylase (PgdA/CDA1 family)
MASMSRFAATTLLAVIIALLLAASLRGFSRVGALLALAGVYVALFALGMSCIRLQFFCPAICRVERQPGRVALTFDDGPDPQATPALLDLLRREGVSATFFCIGKNVAAHPQLAARIAAEGHLLGNHLYSHFWWTSFLRRRGLVGEMMRTQQAIAAAAGVTPRYLRPPVGLLGRAHLRQRPLNADGVAAHQRQDARRQYHRPARRRGIATDTDGDRQRRHY